MQTVFAMLNQMVGEEMEVENLLKHRVNTRDELFTDTIIKIITYLHGEKMPFNKYLGAEVHSLDKEKVQVKINMKENILGNFEQKILHGGVISAALDLTGGIIAQLDATEPMGEITIGEIMNRFFRMSTLNMRVDYLRPGRGDYFIITGRVLKRGKKISVVRCEFENEEGSHLASATLSYMVG